jgi:hypothetical protein
LNGFNGDVTLTLSGLPKGVTGGFKGKGNKRGIGFTADASARTGLFPVTVTGTSGSIKQTLTFTLAVSGAVGESGVGTQVDISSEFDTYGIYTDGSVYTTGGLDGLGYSYSANLLTASRVLDGTLFNFGPANQPDAVACAGQTVTLPAGQFSSLALLGTAVNGNQETQFFVVHYSDGTFAQFAQSFSDWFTPQNFFGEFESVAMRYRNFDNGTKDERPFNLYAYPFALNPSKTVQSITFPDNPDVMVLAVTLVP